MPSGIKLKNAQDQECFINHPDNAGAVNLNSNEIAKLSNIVGFKNLIINGNFDIWQYKDAGLTYPQVSHGYGSDDRWLNGSAGSTKTHSQVACTDTERALFNASKFSRTVVSSVVGAGNYVLKQQAIEDITKLAGKIVTLSFWAKADSSKNIEVRMLQSFGSGGSPSVYVNNIGQQLVSLTSTWQKKTITITVPSIIGKTLGTDGVHTTASWLRFTFDAGSGYEGSTVGQQSGTFDIAQVQLEEGSVATPFEQRPYGLELSLCQRYYEIVYLSYRCYALAGDSVYTTLSMVPKRVAPSYVVVSAGSSNNTGSAITCVFDENNSIRASWTVVSTAMTSFSQAKITLSSEL